MKVKKFSIMAHSFGGYVSLLFSMRFREMIEKIVLLSPVGLSNKYYDIESTTIEDWIQKICYKIEKSPSKIDLIVNRHINELNKFIKDHEEKLIEFRANWKEKFLKSIEQAFQNFIENLDPSLMIYNSDNKLIQIKYQENSNSGYIKNNLNSSVSRSNSIFSSQDCSDARSVKSSKSTEKKINDNYNKITENSGLIFTQKINFGLFNKNKLNFCFFKVSEHIDNDMKNIFIKYVNHLHNMNNSNNLKKINSIGENEEYTINCILKSCDNFGENIFAMVNFFSFDNSENKILHSFEQLNSGTSKIQNELFFESFAKFFHKIENQCKKQNFPFEFDILFFEIVVINILYIIFYFL